MAKVTTIFGGDGVPEEPDWTKIYQDTDDIEIAAEQWGKVVREMREAQTLAVENGHAIRRLIDFRIQYERASRHIGMNGAVLPAKAETAVHGNWNPWWTVMRQSQEAIRYLETELGISPLRRSRAGKVQKRDKKARAADAYLSKAKG